MAKLKKAAGSHSSNFLQIYIKFAILIYINIGLVSCVSVEKDLSMTLKEKQILDKFREQVSSLLYQDYMKTDIYLVRWLRARKFNVNEAEKMLRENIKWRKENKIDTIQTEDFADMWQDLPATVDTQDKEGRPILTIEMYNWDVRQTVLAGQGARALRYLDMLINNITMQVVERQQKGMNVTQWKCLMSAEGFNMVRHGCPICIPYWVQFLNSLENHFPWSVDEFIVVEATFAINTVLNLLKPFFSQQLGETFRIFSSKPQWMAYMDQRISREERRSPYGGTKPPLERF